MLHKMHYHYNVCTCNIPGLLKEELQLLVKYTDQSNVLKVQWLVFTSNANSTIMHVNTCRLAPNTYVKRFPSYPGHCEGMCV